MSNLTKLHHTCKRIIEPEIRDLLESHFNVIMITFRFKQLYAHLSVIAHFSFTRKTDIVIKKYINIYSISNIVILMVRKYITP